MTTLGLPSSNSFSVLSNLSSLPDASPSGPTAAGFDLATHLESLPAFGASMPINRLNQPIGDLLETRGGDIKEVAAAPDARVAGRVDRRVPGGFGTVADENSVVALFHLHIQIPERSLKPFRQFL